MVNRSNVSSYLCSRRAALCAHEQKAPGGTGGASSVLEVLMAAGGLRHLQHRLSVSESCEDPTELSEKGCENDSGAGK